MGLGQWGMVEASEHCSHPSAESYVWAHVHALTGDPAFLCVHRDQQYAAVLTARKSHPQQLQTTCAKKKGLALFDWLLGQHRQGLGKLNWGAGGG